VCEFIDIVKDIVMIMAGILVIVVCVIHLVIYLENKNRKVIIPEVIKEDEEHPLYRHMRRINQKIVDLKKQNKNKYK